jgi:ketosteroid isomerase-like protein
MKIITLLLFFSVNLALGQTADEAAILNNIEQFSTWVVEGNTKAIVGAYTDDASIFPNGQDIITGTDLIQTYWNPKPGNITTFHKIYPIEITIEGYTAYDYGYYEVSGSNQGVPYEQLRGKYVIVWKKTGEQWKIYLDIWNRAAN